MAKETRGGRREGAGRPRGARSRATKEHKATLSDLTSIDCGTDVHNEAAQAAFKAQGRIPIAIMFKYVIKPHVDGKDPLDGTADA